MTAPTHVGWTRHAAERLLERFELRDGTRIKHKLADTVLWRSSAEAVEHLSHRMKL
jgi:hypothetical protein